MSLPRAKPAQPDLLAQQSAECRERSAANSAPLVSIIVSCYNSARYLAETLASATAQSYQNIEIIVVDDGSSDATAGIAQSFPVHYLHQQNQGVSAARNNGLAQSQGEFILFLDHDDRLLPEAVETGVKLLEQHPDRSMAVGEHHYIDANGSLQGSSHKHTVRQDYYLALLEHNFIETPCSVLHRRSALPGSGVFNCTVHGAEDYELYLRIARQSQFILHKTVVAEYRRHDANVSCDAERMIIVTHRVLQMELPYLRGDRKKLQRHNRGLLFMQRHFGRQLTRELIRRRPLTLHEVRRKQTLLRRHYLPGFAAVTLSRLFPSRWLQQLRLA